MNNKNKPLKIFLNGFDPRATKMLVMYLQGQCRGVGQVVNNPEDAEADLYDADIFASNKLLLQQIQDGLTKPTIALSINDLTHAGVLHIKKPVDVDNMVKMLETAKKQAHENQTKGKSGDKQPQITQPAEPISPEKPKASDKNKKAEKPKASTKAKSSEKGINDLKNDAVSDSTTVGNMASKGENDDLEVVNYSEIRNKDRSIGSDLLQETSDWFDL
jgi:hypothetical protein